MNNFEPCVDTFDEWIFPQSEDYPLRPYQLEICDKALFENTLVCLPTGLGKTLIAAVVMYNYYRWFPRGKVIFMAPAKPLVAQQISACYDIMGIPASDTAHLEGSVPQSERRCIWDQKRVIFCTPQVLSNDIEDSIMNCKNIVCLVIDEAHRATGNYAYNTVVDLLNRRSVECRILALTATPTSDFKKFQTILNNLNIAHLEVRSEDDPEIAQYVNDKLYDIVLVPQESLNAVGTVKSMINDALKQWMFRLVKAGLLGDCSSAHLNQVIIDEAKRSLQPNQMDLMGPLTLMSTLLELRRRVTDAGFKGALDYLQQIRQNPGLVAQYLQSAVFSRISSLVEKQNEDANYIEKRQPKIKKLKEILIEHFTRKKSTDTRVIIFVELRTVVYEIVEELKSMEQYGIWPEAFVGQSSKPNSKRVGMKQKEQCEVLQRFNNSNSRPNIGNANRDESHLYYDFDVQSDNRNEGNGGDFVNVLVATSILEEGLDVAEVDLIILFDSVTSVTRLTQRCGRTARKKSGRVVMLAYDNPSEREKQSKSNENMKKMRMMIGNAAGEKSATGIKKRFAFSLKSARMIPVEKRTKPTLRIQTMNIGEFQSHEIAGSKWFSNNANSKEITDDPKQSKATKSMQNNKLSSLTKDRESSALISNGSSVNINRLLDIMHNATSKSNATINHDDSIWFSECENSRNNSAAQPVTTSTTSSNDDIFGFISTRKDSNTSSLAMAAPQCSISCDESRLVVKDKRPQQVIDKIGSTRGTKIINLEQDRDNTLVISPSSNLKQSTAVIDLCGSASKPLNIPTTSKRSTYDDDEVTIIGTSQTMSQCYVPKASPTTTFAKQICVVDHTLKTIFENVKIDSSIASFYELQRQRKLKTSSYEPYKHLREAIAATKAETERVTRGTVDKENSINSLCNTIRKSMGDRDRDRDRDRGELSHITSQLNGDRSLGLYDFHFDIDPSQVLHGSTQRSMMSNDKEVHTLTECRLENNQLKFDFTIASHSQGVKNGVLSQKSTTTKPSDTHTAPTGDILTITKFAETEHSITIAEPLAENYEDILKDAMGFDFHFTQHECLPVPDLVSHSQKRSLSNENDKSSIEKSKNEPPSLLIKSNVNIRSFICCDSDDSDIESGGVEENSEDLIEATVSCNEVGLDTHTEELRPKSPEHSYSNDAFSEVMQPTEYPHDRGHSQHTNTLEPSAILDNSEVRSVMDIPWYSNSEHELSVAIIPKSQISNKMESSLMKPPLGGHIWNPTRGHVSSMGIAGSTDHEFGLQCNEFGNENDSNLIGIMHGGGSPVFSSTGKPKVNNGESVIELSSPILHDTPKSVDDSDDDIACCVCLCTTSEPNYEIIICELCNQGVHWECYGLCKLPVAEFYCDGCRAKKAKMAQDRMKGHSKYFANHSKDSSMSPKKRYRNDEAFCIICDHSEGMLKRSVCGRYYVHLVCALFTPEVTIEENSKRPNNLHKRFNVKDEGRFGMKLQLRNQFDYTQEYACDICSKCQKMPILCAYKDCDRSLHGFCAFSKQTQMVIREANYGRESEILYEIFCYQHRNIASKDPKYHKGELISLLPIQSYRTSMSREVNSTNKNTSYVEKIGKKESIHSMSSSGIIPPSKTIGNKPDWSPGLSPGISPEVQLKFKRLRKVNADNENPSMRANKPSKESKKSKKSSNVVSRSERVYKAPLIYNFIDDQAEVSGSETSDDDDDDDDDDDVDNEIDDSFIDNDEVPKVEMEDSQLDSPDQQNVYLEVNRKLMEESPDIGRNMQRYFRGRLPFISKVLRKYRDNGEDEDMSEVSEMLSENSEYSRMLGHDCLQGSYDSDDNSNAVEGSDMEDKRDKSKKTEANRDVRVKHLKRFAYSESSSDSSSDSSSESSDKKSVILVENDKHKSKKQIVIEFASSDSHKSESGTSSSDSEVIHFNKSKQRVSGNIVDQNHTKLVHHKNAHNVSTVQSADRENISVQSIDTSHVLKQGAGFTKKRPYNASLSSINDSTTNSSNISLLNSSSDLSTELGGFKRLHSDAISELSPNPDLTKKIKRPLKSLGTVTTNLSSSSNSSTANLATYSDLKSNKDSASRTSPWFQHISNSQSNASQRLNKPQPMFKAFRQDMFLQEDDDDIW